MKKLLLPLLLTTALVACAKPQYNAPQVDDAAVQREAQTQEQYSQTGEVKYPIPDESTKSAMRNRLNRVFSPIDKAGEDICRQLTSGSGDCRFSAELSDKATTAQAAQADANTVNAYADGSKIVVNTGMMHFAESDNELAFVLAHELAHNILRHPQSTTTNAVTGSVVGTIVDAIAGSQGFNTGGTFGKLGGQVAVMRYSQAFESEADYVGLYIMARAGLPYEDAANFWRRMSARDSKGIYTNSTHPSNPQRYVAMQQTVREIEAKKSRGQPLLPEMKKN